MGFEDISLPEFILDRLRIWVPLVLSLSVHEWAHAWSAYRLGDDTAARMGRMTLNPLAHIDPVGTVLLPLLGVPFGWAKPVPVNPVRFRREIHMRTGMMITAAAGPISNVCMAFGCMVVLACLIAFNVDMGNVTERVLQLIQWGMIINVILAVFNLFPIPPLDGSRIADGLMPEALRPNWDAFCRLTPIPLIVLIVMLQVPGMNPFGFFFHATGYLLDLMIRLLGG
jgi:Zn-dependent protease